MPRSMRCGFDYERTLWNTGCRPVAGVDEAGRGPLAGPVVACAAVLPEDFTHRTLRDSKELTPRQRDLIYEELASDSAVVWAVAVVGPEEVDRLNILQATHRAMRQAVDALPCTPRHVLVDGLPVRPFPVPQTAIVKGDGISLSIAAASVLAKVTRDRIMEEMDARYPGYEFACHKGYCTARHRELLRKHGPSPIHRRSFLPVAELLLPL